MEAKVRHPWNLTPSEAISLQDRLRKRVIPEDTFHQIRFVAGVDVSYDAKHKVAWAAVVVLTYPTLELKATSLAQREITFPYVPGLLSFREIPALIDCLQKLEAVPDIFICDGQGLAHPRRFGLACHLGVLIDLPSIGVAKRPLIGEYKPVPQERGAWRAIIDKGETIGAALRWRSHAKPIFVSIGHRVSLETAIQIVLNCSPRYRLPETTRWAHKLTRMASAVKP
jgi:deoxyribonuclease V